ncbi:MAG: hypothetical protein F4Z17_01860, partial [Acidimicrobiia bacterium]|nr:hypothetical protein [Acidimicrobiia bacterium]
AMAGGTPPAARNPDGPSRPGVRGDHGSHLRGGGHRGELRGRSGTLGLQRKPGHGPLAGGRGGDVGSGRPAARAGAMGSQQRAQQVRHPHGADAVPVLDRGHPPLHGRLVLRVLRYHPIPLPERVRACQRSLQPDSRAGLPHR